MFSLRSSTAKQHADEAIDKTRSPYGKFQEQGDYLHHHHDGMLTFSKRAKEYSGEQLAKAEMRRVIAAPVAEFDWVYAQAHEPKQGRIVFVHDLCTWIATST